MGIAIGAMIGAALPSTAAEDELVGKESDAVKQKSAEFAGEQIDKGKAVAENAWEAAKQESKEQGLVTGADGDARAVDGDAAFREFESDEASLVPSGDGSTTQKHDHSEH